jgi:hypothetical protein
VTERTTLETIEPFSSLPDTFHRFVQQSPLLTVAVPKGLGQHRGQRQPNADYPTSGITQYTPIDPGLPPLKQMPLRPCMCCLSNSVQPRYLPCSATASSVLGLSIAAYWVDKECVSLFFEFFQGWVNYSVAVPPVQGHPISSFTSISVHHNRRGVRFVDSTMNSIWMTQHDNRPSLIHLSNAPDSDTRPIGVICPDPRDSETLAPNVTDTSAIFQLNHLAHLSSSAG